MARGKGNGVCSIGRGDALCGVVGGVSFDQCMSGKTVRRHHSSGGVEEFEG